ncbi:lysophospholipid acyltransferase family protein [Longivirga aurantiaca]|uniref:Lysophospholipid acyltransferase family protein n=1 Tax=Longivirga aurantiaca TaxID=1837743 RepID=A0ABW1T3Z6_9ACTN
MTTDRAPVGLPTSGAATGRNLAALVTRMWKLRVAGAHHVPVDGPVILAANHTAFLDGLLLAAASPRPVHVLVKSEIFVPPIDRLMRATSQIRIEYDGPDRSALLEAVAVLADAGVVGVFPEVHRGAGDARHLKHGAAYLAARTGALVVPVAILGARPAGTGKDALPRLRSPLDVVFGEPVDIRVEGDARRRAVLARSGERLRQTLSDHVQNAVRRTGQDLPGPLPDTASDHRSTA